jgi:hypothetical protein
VIAARVAASAGAAGGTEGTGAVLVVGARVVGAALAVVGVVGRVVDVATGAEIVVVVDDAEWSPEHPAASTATRPNTPVRQARARLRDPRIVTFPLDSWISTLSALAQS